MTEKTEDYSNVWFHITGLMNIVYTVAFISLLVTLINIFMMLSYSPVMAYSFVGFFVVGSFICIVLMFITGYFINYCFGEHINMFEGRKKYLIKRYKKYYKNKEV